MSDTIQYSGRLTITTCWCGMPHAVPAEMADHQQRCHDEGRTVPDIYCPSGHVHVPAGEPRYKRAERERDRARELETRRLAEREQAEASARAHKGAATKARKRAAAAVCPCCHRSFKQLRRHIQTKHPDYDPEKTGKEKVK